MIWPRGFSEMYIYVQFIILFFFVKNLCSFYLPMGSGGGGDMQDQKKAGQQDSQVKAGHYFPSQQALFSKKSQQPHLILCCHFLIFRGIKGR